MDHSDAIRLKAAEAYLLNELPPSSRREFEEHYFACPQCSQDLETGAAFLDAYQQAHHLEPAPRMVVAEKRRPWIFRPAYALAATALVALTLVYQNAVTIPRLKQSATAQAVETFSLESAASRSQVATVIAAPQGRPFLLLVDIPPSEQQGDYRCVIRSGAGVEMASFQISAAAAQKTVPVLIPAARLKPDRYALTVFRNPAGASDNPIAHYSFDIR